MTTNRNNKILVIGLDGATLELIRPWTEEGHLPVLRKLMHNGTYATLNSVLPVLSSSAWASFFTGMNPGKHGFYDFVRREQDSYRLRPLTRNHMEVPTLWGLLSQAGYKVSLVNIPMTYPPEQVNGLMVTGLGTPDYRPFTYPEELGKTLLERGYQVNKKEHFHPGSEDLFLREVYKTTEKLAEASVDLMEMHEWDFFMLVFRDTDEMHHFFWHFVDSNHPLYDQHLASRYKNAILEYYQLIDSLIGRLMARAGSDTNIWIISDHGGGPLYKDVYLNEWLRIKEFLKLHPRMTNPNRIHDLLIRFGLTRSQISRSLRHKGFGRLELWIKDILGDQIEVLPKTNRLGFPEAIDWKNTKAYSIGYHGQIFINLMGREPMGIVKPGEEYEKVCNDLIQELYNLIDPEDGMPVVDKIYRKEDIYYGPYLDFAPDLTLVMRNFSYITRQGYEFSSKLGTIFSLPNNFESGSHRKDGIIIGFGPDIATNGSIDNPASLMDLTPTILHMFGCSIPSDMDGVVLADWLTTTSEPRFSEPTKNITRNQKQLMLDQQEEQELLERLKKLGYIN